MGGGGNLGNSVTKAEALTLQSSTAGAVVPWLRGRHRIAGNLAWYGDFAASAHQQSSGKGGGSSTSYTYSASLLMLICHGTVSAIPRVWKGQSATTMASLGLTLLSGAIGQATWSGLSGRGAVAIGYSGKAGVAVLNYSLGDSASVENHAFEVTHSSSGAIAGTPDIDPTTAASDLLTDPIRGVGLDSSLLGDWSSWSDYCVASGLLMSPLLTTQAAASDALATIVDLTNSAMYWSEGKLKIKPYGDTAITGNGRTYTPETTPVYQLDDTCYIPDAGASPVACARKGGDDCFNTVKVQYKDRSNSYSPAIAIAQDLTDISVNGPRVDPNTIQADWICDVLVARLVAELKKQRALLVTGTYTIRLSWHYALIECMDLLTLTDAVLQMLNVPVRVTKIVEESDEVLTITCEDYPAGVASASRYPAQVPTGFANDAFTTPPSVTDAVFFEAPGALAAGNSGLEVWGAVGSPGGNWGGCTVWVSLDGTHYTAMTKLEGSSRLGTLGAAISGGNLSLTGVQGQLSSSSATDAALLNSLSYIGGSTPEYLAYQTATLTGAGAYTLSGLVRGALGTSGAPAHTSGDRFVRCDESIAKSGGLDASYVGKTLHFKLTSFNLYGSAEQSLADVSPFSYTVTGAFAANRTGASTLTILKNQSTFTGANYNEAYLCGRDSSGVVADVPGYILLNGVHTAVPNGPLFTNQGPVAAYIVWESAGTGLSTGAGTVNFVMARRNAGVWEYDNNGSGWVALTVTSTMYVIGTIEPGCPDTNAPPGIVAASAWAAASTLNAIVAVADQAYTLALAQGSVTLIADGGVSILGNTVTKTAATSAWDSAFHSKDSFTGGAYVSWVIGSDGYFGVGLNSDPTTDNSFGSIDYWFEYTPGGALAISENGTDRGLTGVTASVGDVLAVAYDGVQVRYFKNGVYVRGVAATITVPLFADSSFYTQGATALNVQFGPMSAVNNIDTLQLAGAAATKVVVFSDATGVGHSSSS